MIVFGAAVRPDGAPSGTLKRRIATAAGTAGTARPLRYLVTGGPVRHPEPEALVMRRLLVELGVREDRILVEDRARNTRESARLCAAILGGRGDVGAVLVCSSRYHLPRCRLLLRLHGIRCGAAVASEDAAALGRARYAYSWLRELAAMPFDALRAVLRRRFGRAP